MRLDAANVAFVLLIGTALGAFALLGTATCALLGALVFRGLTEGAGIFSDLNLGPHLVAVGVVGVAVVRGVRSILRQLTATARLRRRLRASLLPLEPSIEEAAERASLRGLVNYVDHSDAFSLTYGWLQPRVVVTRGLVQSMSAGELLAVLEHERYHALNLDPLKVVVARTLASAFFFIPTLADLRTRYVTARELEADRRALEVHGRRSLAGALYKVVSQPERGDLSAAAAIGGPEALEARVAQLESGRAPAIAWLSGRAIVGTVLGVGGVAWSLAAADLSSALEAMGVAGSPAPPGSRSFAGCVDAVRLP